MAFQIVLNLALSIVWALLNDDWSFVTLVVGYVIGMGLLYVFHNFLPGTFYLKRVWAFIKLTLLFIVELIKANITVAKQVLSPKLNIQPGIFALPTELTTEFEITLLANLITLTPGTLTVNIAPEGNILYIHAMDLPDVEEAIRSIKDTFERQIMEVTR
ncbi:Na+/H+ antiporter subunit E [Rubeoparvulum massiliense]|uniref:Na+/H+ antiporter subunit E n=1 Tax=Rubeoparvulum massiliense TaxID=1631346 RepID=UPI00065E8A4F|nr:Na+/H+ antiporter subunit E [Rubeoparvulum massiliense]